MLQSIPEDLSRDAWLAASWKQTWETAGPSRILRYIRDPGDGGKPASGFPGHAESRPQTGPLRALPERDAGEPWDVAGAEPMGTTTGQARMRWRFSIL
ncbi:hypothetical protein AAFF_G00045840 [Aldrovandia affinis]|uniref:Uncharacterized protein n=1 Tax=Aldrovandia affinis TaxID=143900 RepID=A0AAD7S1V2_9TELE|nr:hypothetical protein AAFF_G00045840 [Aldrovandia affinis]